MPDLEAKFIALTTALRFIVFGLLVTGLIVRLSRHIYHSDEIIRPIARAIVITALVASQGWWFPLVEDGLRGVATYIEPTYNDNPTRVSDQIREGQSPNPDADAAAFSWRNLARSLFHTIVDAVSWLFIQISTLITVPMNLLQYILRWTLYFLTPIALGCFMVPALSGMALRFFQQLLAVLSWPIGFAITNVTTLSLWQGFTAYATSGSATTAVFAPSLINCGLLLAALALLIGTIATPIVCHMFFTQGHALTGASSTPVAIARGLSETAGRAATIKHGAGFGYGFGSAASHAATSAPPPPPPTGHHFHPGL